jgi:hypothetical protein
MAFCAYCGSNLRAEARFCTDCGRETGAPATKILPATQRTWKQSTFFWLTCSVVVFFILVRLIMAFAPNYSPPQEPQGADGGAQKSRDLTQEQVGNILFQHYMPSPNMLNAGVDISSGHWYSTREGRTARCDGDNCYYLEYRFQIVDAQGNSHDVKCEWDVDAADRTATPRNEQARYYWTRARPGWKK